jgi:hypothetical protein
MVSAAGSRFFAIGLDSVISVAGSNRSWRSIVSTSHRPVSGPRSRSAITLPGGNDQASASTLRVTCAAFLPESQSALRLLTPGVSLLISARARLMNSCSSEMK